MERLTVNGLNFTVSVDRDEDMGAPWENHDGHGVVSKWVTRDKMPSERLLSRSCSHKRYYDVAASTEIALRDSWGVANPEGRTKGQIAAEAVDNDFEYIRGWCNDEWWWVYVLVQLVDLEGRHVNGYSESLCGIESTDDIGRIAQELAATLAERIGDRREVCIPVRTEQAA